MTTRTYGGWRLHRGLGLFGLSSRGTLLLLGALTALIVLAAISITAALVAVPVLAAVVGAAVWRRGGRPVAGLVTARLCWGWAHHRGHTRFRAGIVVGDDRSRLPGVLAPTMLMSADDGYGGRYGLVWDRRSGALTTTLKVSPASPWLADADEADAWVSAWGSWLAGLGHQPALRWVTVIVDTAPEPGSTLADAVTRSLDPDAPAPARDIMTSLVARAPAAAADVDTIVCLTFDPARFATPAATRDMAGAVAELGRLTDPLAAALGGCGVSVAGRARAAELAGMVRTAFDPDARGEVNRVLADGSEHLGWADAGPLHAEELLDTYEHENAVSVTWGWHEAPRQAVASTVLARLLAPAGFVKRVALQYRPYPAPDATRMLEYEVNAASFRQHYRRRTGRDETARDAYDAARARQAAEEEAGGAGVSLLGLYVTATVTTPEDLPGAVAATEAAAGSSKIRLRRLWGGQAAGFAATLPCGICPAALRSPR
jgi:hypothetical protein